MSWLTVIALVGVMARLAPPVAAQTEADQQRVADQIRSTRALVGEASAEESRLLALIDASRRRERDLAQRLSAVDGQIGSVGRALDDTRGRLAAVEGRQAAARARLDQLSDEVAASRKALTRQALSAYTGQSEAARYAAMWLRATSAAEIVSKSSYLRVVVGNQTDLIAGAERLRNEVADRRDELASARAATVAERDAVAAHQARLTASRAAQDVLRRDVVGELATKDRLRDETLARKAEFQATLDTLERESRAIAEALRRRAAAGGSPMGGVAPGRLQRPISGAAITSVFGPRVHPIYGDVRSHTGIDFDGSSGTPIRAAAAGVVVSASTLGGYGNCTLVDHGGGLVTLYAHQSAMSVSAGERVVAGQVIGRVGTTGASTGPHLHFEVRRQGDPVNPMPYF